MRDGTAAAQYQEDAAERTVRELPGIRLVQNNINIGSHEERPLLDRHADSVKQR